MNRSLTKVSQAFSLVELLVVIAIIALLIALLMPTLAKGKEFANQTVCYSNLRQISLGFFLYRHDHDEHIPSYEWVSNGDESNFPGLAGGNIGYYIPDADLTYADAVERSEYTNVDVWNCPSVLVPTPNYGWGGNWYKNLTVHDIFIESGPNSGKVLPIAEWEYDIDDPFPVYKLPDPERSYFLMDKTGQGHLHWGHDLDGIHFAASEYPAWNSPTATYVGGQRTVLFFDGHVMKLSHEDYSYAWTPNWNNGADGDIMWFQAKWDSSVPFEDTWSVGVRP